MRHGWLQQQALLLLCQPCAQSLKLFLFVALILKLLAFLLSLLFLLLLLFSVERFGLDELVHASVAPFQRSKQQIGKLEQRLPVAHSHQSMLLIIDIKYEWLLCGRSRHCS